MCPRKHVYQMLAVQIWIDVIVLSNVTHSMAAGIVWTEGMWSIFFYYFVQWCFFTGKSAILSLDLLYQKNDARSTREAEQTAGQNVDDPAGDIAAWSQGRWIQVQEKKDTVTIKCSFSFSEKLGQKVVITWLGTTKEYVFGVFLLTKSKFGSHSGWLLFFTGSVCYRHLHVAAIRL